MFEACEILRDEGAGTSDGISVNMTFVNQEGVPLFHNAEVAPYAAPSTDQLTIPMEQRESQISVLTLGQGESLTHCNKYYRL